MIGQEQRAAIGVSSYATSREVIRETKAVVGGILERHSQVIYSGFAPHILKQELSLALRNFGEQILSKLSQTDVAVDRGMTIYATGVGKERLFKRNMRFGDPVKGDVQDIAGLMWELRFPRGVYVMSGGGGQFFQEGSERWRQQGGAEKPFTMSYDEVIRVEGDSGEIWQNKDYNWDGTRKQ